MAFDFGNARPDGVELTSGAIIIPPSDCPPITIPRAMPRRSPNQFEITSAVGTKVESPSPNLRIVYAMSIGVNAFARLATMSPARFLPS